MIPRCESLVVLKNKRRLFRSPKTFSTSLISPEMQVTFSAGAASLAKADVVIFVFGEKPYAERKSDRTDLRLSAADQELTQNFYEAKGKIELLAR